VISAFRRIVRAGAPRAVRLGARHWAAVTADVGSNACSTASAEESERCGRNPCQAMHEGQLFGPACLLICIP
jgi:hypothetical protein